MIPDYYNTDEPCQTTSHGAKPEDRHSRRDCFFQTWREAPLPWVKAPGPPTFYDKTGAHRYHLISPGIRLDTGRAQIWCNRGIAPGPYIWRERPPNRMIDREGACAHCLSHWLREEANVTVTYAKSTAIRVKKGQLAKLLEAVGGTDLMDVELRPTAVEDQPALIAEWSESGSKNDRVKHRVLLIGDGLITLA